jgi:hypothetical protein
MKRTFLAFILFTSSLLVASWSVFSLALGADADSWFVLAKGKLAEVAVEHVLYESAPTDYFLIHIRVTNQTDYTLGIDLRDRWGAVYPNKWGYQPQREPIIINEMRRRRIDKLLTEKEQAQLKAEFAAGKLNSIPAKQSVDYFQIFNASSAHDVKTKPQEKYLMISLDGEQRITDGQTVERLSLEWGPGMGPVQTSLIIPTPILWKPLPAKARVIDDPLFPRKAPKER